MWTTLPLALALTLAPGQANPLTITNARATYGLLGSARPESKIFPGDQFWVAFDIEGVKVDKNGKIQYSMGMEITDAKGKTHYKREPTDLDAWNSLGGTRLPACAHVDIGLDMPPGDYILKVTVTDRAAKLSRVLTRKFEVVKKDFAIVQLNTTSDPDGRIPAPPVGVVGQNLWVNFGTVGFERDKTKQPKVKVEMSILDENNKPTVKEPFTGEVSSGVQDDVQGVPMQFLLALNRPGKFTVKLLARDEVSKKKTEVSFPVTVLELK
jgi:hypothetical protein